MIADTKSFKSFAKKNENVSVHNVRAKSQREQLREVKLAIYYVPVTKPEVSLIIYLISNVQFYILKCK